MPDMIAGYVGQTTEKVKQKVNEALDGVLFIDEAYALVRNSSLFTASYGQEAVDTLVKAIEDHKHRLVVILAGYPKEMEVLLKSNPGLKSRFAPPLHFHDFTTENMLDLLERISNDDGLSMPEEVKETFINILVSKQSEDPTSFGNARDLIANYELAKDHLAMRIIETIGNKAGKQAQLPPEANQFILSDVTRDGYTVVVESPADAPINKNRRMKSWVIPNS